MNDQLICKGKGIDFNCFDDCMLVLSFEEVVEDDQIAQLDRVYTKTHPDGWTITASLNEDWFWFVRHFEARHPKFGCVAGDFEHKVFADSEEAFDHFFVHHGPQEFDCGDI